MPPFQCQWCGRLWCSYCTGRTKGDSTPYSCREGFGCTVLPTPRGGSFSPSPHLSPYSPQFSPLLFQGSQSPPSTAPSPTSSWDLPSQPTPSRPPSPVSPTTQHPTYFPTPPAPSPSSPSQNGRSSPPPPSHKRRRSIAADFFEDSQPLPAISTSSQVSAYSSQSYSPSQDISLELGGNHVIDNEASLEENVFFEDGRREDGEEASTHTQPSSPGQEIYGGASLGVDDHTYSSNPSTQSQQTQPSQNLASEAIDLPSMEDVFHTYVPTIKHIPKGARGNWAKVWSESLNPQTSKEWLLHYMLPKCILPGNKVIRKRGGPTHTAIIKEHILRWRKGGAKEL